MPPGAAVGLAASPTRSRVSGHWKALSFMGTEEQVTVIYPCCDAVDVGTPQAAICPKTIRASEPTPAVSPRDVPRAQGP